MTTWTRHNLAGYLEVKCEMFYRGFLIFSFPCGSTSVRCFNPLCNAQTGMQMYVICGVLCSKSMHCVLHILHLRCFSCELVIARSLSFYLKKWPHNPFWGSYANELQSRWWTAAVSKQLHQTICSGDAAFPVVKLQRNYQGTICRVNTHQLQKQNSL